MVRNISLKLDQFFAIPIFSAYCKVTGISTNAPATPTVPNNITGTDTLYRKNTQVDKYIGNKIYLKFFPFMAHFLGQITKLCRRFSPRPLLHPPRRLPKIDITLLIAINLFSWYYVNLEDFYGQSHSVNVKCFSR